MTLAVFLAVLFAALLHAGWNALVKLGLDRFSSILFLALVQGGIALLLLPFFGLPPRAAWPWVLAGSALHSGYKLVLIRAYGHGDLSQVYPLARGTAPLIVAVAGALFLGEAMHAGADRRRCWRSPAGIMLMAGRGGLDPRRPRLGARPPPPSPPPTPWPTGSARGSPARPRPSPCRCSSLDGLIMLAFGLAARGGGACRSPCCRPGAAALAAGAMSLGAYWIAIWAFTQAPLAMVAALRETSVLFAMLIAALLLKERVGPRRWAAAALILAGVALMRRLSPFPQLCAVMDSRFRGNDVAWGDAHPSPMSAASPRSILGQPWRWRGAAADGHDEGFQPDDLIDQLLMARGVAREELERHRRADPARLHARSVASSATWTKRRSGSPTRSRRARRSPCSAIMTSTARPRRPCWCGCCAELGGEPEAYIPDRLMEGYGPSGEALVRLARGGRAADRHRRLRRPGVRGAGDGARGRGRRDRRRPSQMRERASRRAAPWSIPNRLDEASEAAAHGHLAAVGVCFLLGAALLRTLRGRGFFAGREEPRLIDLLDLVALGTVADVAAAARPQPRLRHPGPEGDGAAPQCRPRRADRRGAADRGADLHRSRLGARAADQCRRPGRQVGPRRAAADHRGSGRGARRSPPSSTGSTRSAGRSRRSVCEAAEALCGGQGNRAVTLVAARGLASGRDRHRRRAAEGEVRAGRRSSSRSARTGIGKGSGRSIGGVDLGAAVLAAKDSGLLVAGGGHAMAAGLTVERDRIEALADFLDERLARRRRAKPRRPRPAARRGAGAGRSLPGPVRRAGGGRALWRGLAGAAGGGGAGQGDQGRRGRQRPFAADRRRRRRPPDQGDRLPHGRRAARRGDARRAAAPQAVGRRPGRSSTNGATASPPSSISRTPPGPIERRGVRSPLTRRGFT